MTRFQISAAALLLLAGCQTATLESGAPAFVAAPTEAADDWRMTYRPGGLPFIR